MGETTILTLHRPLMSEDSWFTQSTYHNPVAPLAPEVELSPSFHSITEVCLGMPYPTVSTLFLWFSGTCCMKILPDGAFPIRTPDLQFSRCDAFSALGVLSG